MTSLRFGHQAEEDLIEIWEYVAQRDPRGADRLLDNFRDRLNLLTQHPLAGPKREDLVVGIRYLVMGEYLAFYRVGKDAVEIIRVLHGRRNISAEDISP